MERERNILGHQEGVALIIALIILLVLTLIGISAISTTTFETSLSGNERAGMSAFYLADAAVERGHNQIPDMSHISQTTPEGNYSAVIKGPDDLGPTRVPGFEASEMYRHGETPGRFDRYQVNGIGESFGAKKEIEIQVRSTPH